MAAPLLIGTDLRKATAETMAIYSNKDVIAVDQDKLGVQGQVIASANGTKVFNKPLANGDRAVALYNSTDSPVRVSTTAAQIGLKKAHDYQLFDLWSKAKTETAGTISTTVPAHGTVIYRVSVAKGGAKLAPATSLDVTSPSGYNGASAAVTAGGSTTLSTAVRDYGRTKLTDVRVSGDAPDGWTLTPTTKWQGKSVKTNGAFTTQWQLTAPAGASTGSYPLTFTATYRYGKKTGQLQFHGTALVLPPPPKGTVALSDVTWTSATNGWGPVEKDMSNGETGAGDGQPISIRGTKYAKGLGTNATSDITYYLGGNCTSLKTDVGIDDEEQAKGGDVIFQIFAGDNKVADSGVLTNKSAVKSLTADLTGAQWLRLHVDPDGANTYDHGDWAGPVLTCNS
jgi:alpha-galactosidase